MDNNIIDSSNTGRNKERMKWKLHDLSFQFAQFLLVGAEEDERNDSVAGAVAAMIIELKDKKRTKRRSFLGEDVARESMQQRKEFWGSIGNLRAHYFSGMDSLYDENDFEWHFILKWHIFIKLFKQIQGCDPFIQKRLHRKKWHSSTLLICCVFASSCIWQCVWPPGWIPPAVGIGIEWQHGSNLAGTFMKGHPHDGILEAYPNRWRYWWWM